MPWILEPPSLLAGEIDDDEILPAVAVNVFGPVHERVAVGFDVEGVGLFGEDVHFPGGGRIGGARNATEGVPYSAGGMPGFSYQTEPAEMSRRPSLLKSPMPTPSLRKARSSVVFLNVTLADLPSAVGFDAGYGRAGTGGGD